MKLLLATANLHKLQEIRDLLGDVPGLELLSLRDYPGLQLPEETGVTMRENARLKAAHCARETGLPGLADDSGIEVDALDGAPGVRSARWFEGSDADRTQALLDRLTDVPEEMRGARYRCALCLALPVPEGATAAPGLTYEETEATCEGRIGYQPRGANGFGYDPVFEITSATSAGAEWIGRTVAEAPPAVKASASHRARAISLLKPALLRLSPPGI